MKGASLLTRLGLASAVLVLGIVGVFSALAFAVRASHEAVDEIRRVDAVLTEVTELETLALALQAGARGYVISGDPLFLASAKRAERGYGRPIAALGRLVRTPEQRQRLNGLDASLDAYVREWYRPLVAVAGRDRGRASRMVSSGEGERRMVELQALLAEFAGAERRIAERGEARAKRRELLADRGADAGLAVCLLLVLLTFLYVWRTVVAPVSVIAGTARAVAAGDLSVRVQQRGAGEVAELTTDFNAMIAALEDSRAELRGRTDRLEALFASSPSAIVAVDLTDPESGPVVSGWSAAAERLFGTPAEDAVGAALSSLETVGDDLAELLIRATLGERRADVRIAFRNAGGHEVQTSVATAPLHDMTGELVGAVAVLTDITERQRAENQRRELEAELQDAQRLESLGVLAGGIAHDFNNLLTGVLGNASLVLQGSSLDAPARVKVEQIELAATRAAELTKQMLAYSGKGRFVVRPLDLRLVVTEMQDLLVASIPKGAILEHHLPADLPPVEADAGQIRQVLMNLIVNGAEALEGKPGVVSIHGRAVRADRELLDRYRFGAGAPEGDYVAIEVSDTGCGMDADTLERIFEPFFTTKFTGRGLGLAAVLGIVRGHYGAVQIYSEPGSGTTFKLLLPAGTSPAVQETVALESGWRGEGTVLVADDEAVVRSFVAATLERAGFTVQAVDDGAAAVAAVSECADTFFRVVLLDLMMPGMGGENAFAHIRRLRPRLPIMMMSGYNEQDVSNQFAGQDLASFVQKPFRPAELVAKLRAVLEPDASA